MRNQAFGQAAWQATMAYGALGRVKNSWKTLAQKLDQVMSHSQEAKTFPHMTSCHNPLSGSVQLLVKMHHQTDIQAHPVGSLTKTMSRSWRHFILVGLPLYRQRTRGSSRAWQLPSPIDRKSVV